MSFYIGPTQKVVVNTKFRKNYYNINPGIFTYDLKLNKNNTFDTVSLLEAKIPKTMYQVKTNLYTGLGNKFVIDVNGSTFDIVIPSGNYTKTSLVLVLTNLLDAAISGSYCQYPDNSTEVQTGKLSFYISNAAGVPISFIFTDDNSYRILELLGFSLYQNNIDAINGTFALSYLNATYYTIVSQNYILVGLPTTLYLKTDLIDGNGNDYVLQEFDTKNIVDDNIVFPSSETHANSKPLINNGHSLFQFNLADDNNFAIDMNGANFQFTLLFYTSNKLDSFLIRNLKIKNIQEIEKYQKEFENNKDNKDQVIINEDQVVKDIDNIILNT